MILETGAGVHILECLLYMNPTHINLIIKEALYALAHVKYQRKTMNEYVKRIQRVHS